MSKEQLQSLQLEFLSRYEGSEEKFMEHASEANTRYYNAIKIKLMEKELSENVKVMNKEWIVFNKKTKTPKPQKLKNLIIATINYTGM